MSSPVVPDLVAPPERVRILIADDDRVARRVLAAALSRWDFDVVAAGDGEDAWELISRTHPPIIILDWVMPGMDGPALCRRIRADATHAHAYVMLLTSRQNTSDVVIGLEAGADDYLTKPFKRDELKARVDVGVRIVKLQRELTRQISALEQALERVHLMEGLLPICSYCKRIRSDAEEWEQMEHYITTHTAAQFSHSVCPTCLTKLTS